MKNNFGNKARLQHILDAISEIEWREIVGLRNILIHEYFGVDENILWEIIKKDIPKLKIKLEEILGHL